MSTFQERRPEYEISSKVRTVARYAFEWIYPLQDSGLVIPKRKNRCVCSGAVAFSAAAGGSSRVAGAASNTISVTSKPCTSNLKPQALNPQPHTIHYSTHGEPYTFNPQPENLKSADR